ncbi:MAG TPA: cytochrome b/b6 domain-containing protein [Gammaproteobacteria bacterium]|nr:cytochrome b/b6 domain-containing protein [Gammaproteobacteria bacterium]
MATSTGPLRPLDEGKAASRNRLPASRGQTYVWDIFIRTFHWLLVTAFVVAYLTAEEIETVHIWAGYVTGILVAMRIVWGFIGPEHARFSDFVYSPARVAATARDLARFRGKRYLGHNPVGGASALVMLCLLVIITLSGLAIYAAADNAGPLAWWLGGADRKVKGILEEVHEISANIMVALIILHIIGVIFESFLHRENLVKSMWTGLKRSK